MLIKYTFLAKIITSTNSESFMYNIYNLNIDAAFLTVYKTL